jgi:transcriptional regulator with XRE-family HTH domain
MNADELKQERARRKMTQTEMAKFLGVPASTYIKWESDKNRKKPIPTLAADKLTETQELDLSLLSILEIAELDKLAREKGTTITKLMGDFIRDGLRAAKGIIPLIALLVVGYQAFQPRSEDQFARRFGRRREGAGAVEIMGEA